MLKNLPQTLNNDQYPDMLNNLIKNYLFFKLYLYSIIKNQGMRKKSRKTIHELGVLEFCEFAPGVL